MLMTDVSTSVDPKIFNFIRAIEDKIKAKYSDAEFELLDGPDEMLHLKVFTDQAKSFWDPIELVKDELLSLQQREGIALHVIPQAMEDKEDCEYDNTPDFLLNSDSV
jgi:hypothetical protein